MKHLADKLDSRRLIGILFLKMHDQPEGAVLEGGVRGADDDSIPVARRLSVLIWEAGLNTKRVC
jgi:hypothetical protein